MSAYSPNASDDLVFYGTDGIEAEEFVRSVIKMAKAAGRLHDHDWIIEEVYTSLAGDALRWYIELDEDIRSDWFRLQRAIMQKYPPPSQRSLRNNDTPRLNHPPAIPIPAAAAPQPVLARSSNNPKRDLCIRIILQDAARSLFIGIKNGRAVTVRDRTGAAHVRHDRQTKQLLVIDESDTVGKIIARSEPRSTLLGNLQDRIPFDGNLLFLKYPNQPEGPFSLFSQRYSISTWNVTDDNIRPEVGQGGPVSWISLHLRSYGAGQPIGASFSILAPESSGSLKTVTLKLEEM